MVWVILDINMLIVGSNKIVRSLAIAVLIAAFPFFFFCGEIEGASNLMGALWDCGHVVFFVALVVVIAKKYDVNNWRVGLLISLSVFVGGGLIEIIQAYIGRDGNWQDLWRDLTGTWLGLFWMQRSCKWVWLGRIFSSVLLLPSLTAVFFESWYQFYAQNEFPLLSGFESSVELKWLNPNTTRSDQFYSQGSYSLKVKLTTNPYEGVKFGRLLHDWRGFDYLAFDIYNPDDAPFYMTIRVNDIYHPQHAWENTDRFNRSFRLNSGWNYLSFPIADIQRAPLNREMDLSKISWVEVFVGKLPENRVIYLDNLRLE